MAAMLTAGAVLLRGDDKGLGIFLTIIAIIVSRILILDIAPRGPKQD